jgi:hypothetical protein
LKEEYEKVRAEKGENSKAAANLAIKYNQAEGALAKMQGALKETTKEMENQASKSGKLGDKIVDLNKRLDDATNKFEAVGQKLTSVGSKLSMGVTAPLLAIGAASTKMAMEATESENLFEVSLGKSAEAVREWSNKISNELGLNEYAVRKNAATFNTMFESMGIGTEKAVKMSEGLTQLAYDMASFYNIKPEVAFEKLRSGISGETEPLKQLGVMINDTTTKAYALKTGIIKQGETMTEQEKVIARYGLILESTSKAQGDLARTIDSPTNKLRIMQERISEMAIKIGEVLIPTFERLLSIFEPIIRAIGNMDKQTLTFWITLAALVAVIGPIVATIGGIVTAIGAVTSVLGVANVTALETVAVVVAVCAALVALAGVIAIIAGKGPEMNATLSNWNKSLGSYSQYKVGKNARGTNNWGGGPTLINEDGGEIVDLPQGTRIYPHDVSMEMAKNSDSGNGGDTYNFYNVPMDQIGEVKELVSYAKRRKQTVRAGYAGV